MNIQGSGTAPDDPSLPEAVRKRWKILDVRALERAESILKSIGQKRLDELGALIKALVKSHSDPPRLRLRMLYKIADEMMAHTQGFVACKRGCSHCCYTPVPITPIEADLIGADIRVKRRTAPLREVATPTQPFEGYTKPCTFLVNGACSIYEHRPLACRIHYSVDDDDMLCRLDHPGPIPVPYLDVTPFRTAYLALTGMRVADIREFFPKGARR